MRTSKLATVRVAFLVLACFLLTGVAVTPSPSPTPAIPPASPMPVISATPGISPTPILSPTPIPSPTPAPSPTPIQSPTPAPSVSPTPVATPTILMLPPDAPPQILWIQLSSTTPRAGDTLSVIVLTSSNVASVELRVAGYGASLPKTDVGRFEGTSTVPRLPFFINHNLTMQIIARNTAGVAIEKDFPFQVR